MKKVMAVMALALFFCAGTASYAAEPREFISEKVPDEVQKLIDNFQVVRLGQKGVSASETDVLDYGLVFFSIYENYIAAMLEGREPSVDVTVFWALTSVKDEKGEIVDYNGELVGAVFNAENLRWFKNAKVKEVFEKAIK